MHKMLLVADINKTDAYLLSLLHYYRFREGKGAAVDGKPVINIPVGRVGDRVPVALQHFLGLMFMLGR